MSDKLTHTHAAVANALGDLAKLFKPECKLTFVMRHPTDEECYIVIGDDMEHEKVIETIRRSEAQKPRELTPAELVKQRLGL